MTRNVMSVKEEFCTNGWADLQFLIIALFELFMKELPWADPEGRGGSGGPDSPPPPHPRNCQIINFCHVEVFRQTPSGNLDHPPPPP